MKPAPDRIRLLVASVPWRADYVAPHEYVMADWTAYGGRVTLSRHPIKRKERDVAGKKRPKSVAQTEKKAPAKAKRPRKTSRGK